MTEDAAVAKINVRVPSVARIYDHLLGGKDNYLSDREAARRILEIVPDAALAARQNRAFLRRAIRFLAAEAGMRQFLDVGAGLPTVCNTHEVAQSAALESRVVYVDNDPMVLVHARALLTSSEAGRCGYVDCDLRDPAGVVRQAAETLDFTWPVAVLLVAILHFIPDSDSPGEIVNRLMAAAAPGSYLVISHATPENLEAASEYALGDVYAATPSGGVTPRWLPAIGDFFGGLELISPGVVDIAAWRPEPGDPEGARTLFYGGVARKDG